MIRRVRATDQAAVERLWQELMDCHAEMDPGLPRPTPNGAHFYAERLIERMDDENTCTLVAEENGQVIGYVLGAIIDLMPDVFDQQPSGFLADIYVDPAYRGNGVGRALVNGLVSWFRGHGVNYYEWNAAARNHDARAFWAALGGRDVIVRMRIELGS